MDLGNTVIVEVSVVSPDMHCLVGVRKIAGVVDIADVGDALIKIDKEFSIQKNTFL